MSKTIKSVVARFFSLAIMANYLFRAVAYFFAIAIVMALHYEKLGSFSYYDYISIAAYLCIPVIFLIIYRTSKTPFVIYRNVTRDFFVIGWMIGQFGFSLLPSSIYAIAAICSYISLVGFHRLQNLLLIPLGIVISAYLNNFTVSIDSSYFITGLSLTYGAFHFMMLSHISSVYSQKQREAKKLIQEQNEKINEQSQEILAQSEELVTLNESLMELNGTLEDKVAQRTKEIELKNKKLAEFAFFNAHILRAPIANIMGLTRLFKKSKPEDYDRIVEKLESSVLKVDDRIRHIMTKLETDDLDNDEGLKM